MTTTDPIPEHPVELRDMRRSVLFDAEARLRELFPDAVAVRSPGSCLCCISAEALWHGTSLLVHHPRCIARPGAVDE